MKRRIIIAFLVLTLCLLPLVAVSAAETTDFVYDKADLLSSSQETRLRAELQSVSQTYGAQIVVYTTNNTQGGNIDRFVENLYDTMGFGYGDRHDGVLLLVCMDVREYRILSNGLGADAISLGAIDDISEAIASDLSDGDYYDAFEEFAAQCEYYLDGHINGFPFNFGMHLVIAVGVGLLVGLIVASVLKSQLKSVYKQRAANVYVKSGSMQLTTQSDLYLYRNVVRTKKESNNSSRSGSSRSGSSRNVGGGKF